MGFNICLMTILMGDARGDKVYNKEWGLNHIQPAKMGIEWNIQPMMVSDVLYVQRCLS